MHLSDFTKFRRSPMPDGEMTPTDEETLLWVALNEVHGRIHRAMERALAAEGLPPLKWYDILWAFETSGAEGVRARHLRERVLFEQSHLSRLLAKLVARGLIRETVCDRDRRAKILRITEEGARLRRRMWQVYGAQIHQHMQVLAADGYAPVLLDRLRQKSAVETGGEGA